MPVARKAEALITAPGAERRRGRPVKYPAGLLATAQTFGPELRGKKDQGRSTRYLLARSMGMLFADRHGLAWLVDRARIDAGEDKLAWKPTVCAELGQMLADGWPEEDALALARRLCEERPTVKAAVAYLRQVRRRAAGREEKAGSVLELAIELERTVNGYLARQPGVSWGKVVEALEFVAAECRTNATREAAP